MTKASIKLPDGTSVEIEGSPEEVAKLLELYGGSDKLSGSLGDEISTTRKRASRKASSKRKKTTISADDKSNDRGPDLVKIIETIRNCDEAEAIETQILDKSGQVNRILLPLYIMHEYHDNAFGLTSGDISRITSDLGVPVQTPNASRTLSGIASRYVIGDTVRKKGQPVRYKLSRRGIQYFKGILNDGTND